MGSHEKYELRTWTTGLQISGVWRWLHLDHELSSCIIGGWGLGRGKLSLALDGVLGEGGVHEA